MPIECEQLKDWKAVASAATAGPWRARQLDDSAALLSTSTGASLVLQDGILAAEDAAFIVAARNAVPALISEVQRLQEIERHARAVLPLLEIRGHAHTSGRQGGCPACELESLLLK